MRFNTVSDQSNLALIECIADHLRSLQVPLRLTRDAEGRKAYMAGLTFRTLSAAKAARALQDGTRARAKSSRRRGPTCATAGCTAVAAPT